MALSCLSASMSPPANPKHPSPQRRGLPAQAHAKDAAAWQRPGAHASDDPILPASAPHAIRPPAPSPLPRYMGEPLATMPDPMSNAGHWRMALEDLRATCPRWTTLAPGYGTVPRELDGRYFRNGPGSLQVYGKPLANIVDGDGCVHAFDFRDGKVRYRNAFVRTRARCEEEAAGRQLFGGIGHVPPGGIRAHLHGRNVRKPANTMPIFHAGALRALYEGDWPYRLDPETLETLAYDDLGGVLRPGHYYAAHPKHDARDGSLWNIGTHHRPKLRDGRVGLGLDVSIYRTDAAGKTTCRGQLSAPYPAAFVHDFVMSDDHLVLMLSPLLLHRVPELLLAKIAPFQALQWRDDLPTYFFVIDKAAPDKVRTFVAVADLAVHLIQGFVSGDNLIVDACCYADAAPLTLAGTMTQGKANPYVQAVVKRYTLRPDAGTATAQMLSPYAFDFPQLSPVIPQGVQHRYVVGNFMDAYSPFTDLLGTLDLHSGDVTLRPQRRPGDYSGEFVPVRKTGGRDELDFWLLGINLDTLHGRSELVIYDGAKPHDDAVCRLPLPHRLPIGFHGSWADRAALSKVVYADEDAQAP